LIFSGTDNTNTLYLDNGAGLNMNGKSDFRLDALDMITFMYSSYNGEWIEFIGIKNTNSNN